MRSRSHLSASVPAEVDGTIYFDITDHPLEGYNKFIPY